MGDGDILSEDLEEKLKDRMREKAEELLEESVDASSPMRPREVVAKTPWTDYPGEEFDEFRLELRREKDG